MREMMGRCPEVDWTSSVHESVIMGPNSWVASNVIIGKDSFVGHSVSIRDFAHVGSRVSIGHNSFVGEGCFIGDGVHLAPSSAIHAGHRITQSTITILGSNWTPTLHEYGITIGCQTHTPEHWAEHGEEIIKGEQLDFDWKENLDAAIVLWHSFFEWTS